MKPDVIKNFKIRFWGKIFVYAIFMSIFCYVLALLMPWYDSNPIWLSLFGFLGSLTIPLFIKVGAPSKQKTLWEYERIEKDFEESGSQLILQTFGSKDFEILYMEEGNWRPAYAIDMYRKLIQKEQTKNNPVLRFHLFVNLAKYYARDRQLKEAIQSLQNAISIKPTSLIANFRLANLYERVGSGGDAITHYQFAKKDSDSINKIEEYLESQVRRVKAKGPRTDGPYSGAGLQWLS